MILLRELLEMASAAGQHPTYPDSVVQNVQQWMLDNPDSDVPIEGRKFRLVTKHDGDQTSYALFQDGVICGWVVLKGTVNVGGSVARLMGNIYIPPQHRKTLATAILIHALRRVVPEPLYIPDTVFVDGIELLNALAKRQNVYGVFSVNRKTGKKLPYVAGDVTVRDENDILIECYATPLSGTIPHPGGSMEVVYEFFSE